MIDRYIVYVNDEPVGRYALLSNAVRQANEHRRSKTVAIMDLSTNRYVTGWWRMVGAK